MKREGWGTDGHRRSTSLKIPASQSPRGGKRDWVYQKGKK